MKQVVEYQFSGAALTAIGDVFSVRVPVTGEISSIFLWSKPGETNTAGENVFNFAKNGVNLYAGADRLSLPANAETATINGNVEPVTRGDVLTVKLETMAAGGVKTPLTVVFVINDYNTGINNVGAGEDLAMGYDIVADKILLKGVGKGVGVEVATAGEFNDTLLVSLANYSLIAEKIIPIAADFILIEDTAAAGIKKKIKISSLPSSGPSGGTTLPSGDLNASTNKLEKVQGRNLFIPPMPTVDVSWAAGLPAGASLTVNADNSLEYVVGSGWKARNTNEAIAGDFDFIFKILSNGNYLNIGIDLALNTPDEYLDCNFYFSETNAPNDLKIRHGANLVYANGTYAVNDVFKINRTGDILRYYKQAGGIGNFVLLFTSSAIAAGSYKAAVQSNSVGAKMKVIRFGNYFADDTLLDKSLLWYRTAAARFENVSLTDLKIALAIQSSLLIGSVPFSDGSTLIQDSLNLFWNNLTKRLGIGTNNPAEKLDVAGNILLSNGGSLNGYGGSRVAFGDDGGQNAIRFAPFGNGSYFKTFISGGLYFQFVPTNGITRFDSYNAALALGVNSGNAVFINTSNNVGIGTASPTEKLDVAGNVKASGSMIVGSLSGLNTRMVTVDVAGNLLSQAIPTNGGTLSQTEQSFSTTSIADTTSELKNVAVGKVSMVRKIESNVPCRIRAYSTAAYRTADAARAIGIDPQGEHGLLLEAVTEAANLVLDASDMSSLFNADAPAVNTIYFNIQNRSGITQIVTVTITKLVLEA